MSVIQFWNPEKCDKQSISAILLKKVLNLQTAAVRWKVWAMHC